MNEQKYLDQIAIEDNYGFLKDVEHFCNHRPLLWLGLHLIDPAKPVIELGSGHGSTKYLRAWCKEKGIDFKTYDNNPDWCEKTGSEYIEDWEAVDMMAERADIVVLHDAEEVGSGNYQYEKIYPLFKYKLGYNLTGGGAGCVAVSNTIDLSVFKGLKLGGFEFE
jgi:hypothetical protein